MTATEGAAGVQAAADALARGRVVAIPTDTVYGLAVNPLVDGAVDALFALKGRPRSAAIPVLVADVEQARLVGDMTRVEAVVAALWPGALTLVVPRQPRWREVDLGEPGEPGEPREPGEPGEASAPGAHGESARAATGTVALRCPAHRLARELCELVGPLAVTSANRHGEPAPWTAAAVDVAGVELVLDGGPGAGSASSIVDVAGLIPRELRPGPVSFAAVVALLR